MTPEEKVAASLQDLIRTLETNLKLSSKNETSAVGRNDNLSITDHDCRGQFDEQLHGPFPLEELPVELVLRILTLSAGASQSTYRSLLLVSGQIHDLTRLECLPVVPVIISTWHQLTSFHALVTSQPEIASQVQYLWIAPHNTGFLAKKLGGAAINACRNIVCLGSSSVVLHASIDLSQSFHHTRCTELTIVGNMNFIPIHASQLYNQIKRIHFVGLPRFAIPGLTSLTHLCISVLRDCELVGKIITAGAHLWPGVQQIVIATRLRDDELAFLASALYEIDHRYCVMYSSQTWTDVWTSGVRDEGRFWSQAKEETDRLLQFRL
jgi:hypothetical protein